MKTRHAAALALVSWYLILPRLTEGIGRPSFDANTPLFQWTVYGNIPGGIAFEGYDSVAECEQMKQFVKDREKKNLPSPGDSARTTEEAFALTTTFALCVSSDDPRLKKE